ncbi:MAG: Rossmann fold nucleotide-binding protein Smf [Ignavibacteriae bacterium]|nr:MAG: Rossmann fold nucleotide-binding protein Smf [Ignavibacteriota bacterium]
MVDIRNLLMLTCIPGIGSNRVRQLISHFKNSKDVFYASPKELIQIEGFNKKLAYKITNFKNTPEFKKAEEYSNHQLSKLNKIGGRIITYWDNEYPELLKKIFDPPPFIFVLGKLEKVDRYSIAIVGTRNPSRYGISVTEKFTTELVQMGIPIVSGLARGIDTIAHSTVLKNGGRTIAVIGSGLDVIYPPENKNLFWKIAENGAIISEYEMGAQPDAVNFPRRNRIISGISLGTLVIETGIDGGAMITAQTAFDQNREVFAIPGLITESRSNGCNTLIRDNRAKLVITVEDILNELGNKLKPILKIPTKIDSKPEPDLTLFEKKIYELLNDEPTHIDLIAEKSGLSVSDVLVNLLNLEFKGVVKQLPGKMFVRS